MSVCHAEKAVTDRCGHRDGGFALSFPPTLSCVQPEGFYWAPSLLPLTVWPCSPTAVSWHPLGFSTLPQPARMRVQPWPSLHHLGSSEEAGVAEAAVAVGCRRVLPGLSRPPPGKHTSFALLPVHMLDKETDPH